MMGLIYILLQIRESAFRMKEIYVSTNAYFAAKLCNDNQHKHWTYEQKQKKIRNKFARTRNEIHKFTTFWIILAIFNIFHVYIYQCTYIYIHLYEYPILWSLITWHIWIIFRASELHSLLDWRYSIKHST